MKHNQKDILDILDQCAKEFTFPVLDNGYVYLAATRMYVYRSNNDWAIVIEVFGFSPRSGDPDIFIYTFSNNLINRKTRESYVSEEAYTNYINNNPYNEASFVYPIDNDDWKNEDDCEFTKISSSCSLRGEMIRLPRNNEYQELGINLEEETPLTYEFCRYLAKKYRNKVLCNEEERRVNISPDMNQLLMLDEWHHPDISEGELPSQVETFKQIAEVLVSGNLEVYSPSSPANTHWENWPEGGTL